MKKLLLILSLLFAMSSICFGYTGISAYMDKIESDDPNEMFKVLNEYFSQKFDFEKFTQEEKVANTVELAVVDYYFENFEEPDSLATLKYMLSLYDYTDEDLKDEFFENYDSVKNYSKNIESIYNLFPND